jgi:hypothetical protein
MTETLEPGGPSQSVLVSRGAAARAPITCVASILLLAALWSVTHRYRGLVGDAALYAVQALARTQVGLKHDVFLSSGSQDRYTIFSPLYSFLISVIGLRLAAISLLVFLKVWFYAAIWGFGRRLSDSRMAWLTVILVVLVPGEYGAYHVFHLSEDMLTARSLAEALAMTALYLHVRGRKAAALSLAVLGLLVHPLMALPMVLVLLSLHIRLRARILFAIGAAVTALACAAFAIAKPRLAAGVLTIMDPAWLEMVRERSQFVFPQLWRVEDWTLNARPFVALALSMLVLRDCRVRAICASALIVGTAGLAIAVIAGGLGPVAILLQGQTWRWVWIPEIISICLIAPTVREMWRSDRCGALCSVLLLLGTLFSVIDGVYCVAAALCLWAGRRHIPGNAGLYIQFAAAAIALLAVGWVIAQGLSTLSSLASPAAGGGTVLRVTRGFMGLDLLPAIVALLLWCAILASRSVIVPALMGAGLGAVTVLAAPSALQDPRIEDTASQVEEFADWRSAIPADANVFVADRYYSAGFAWFTLERPSYLTVDQSSGVIFSKATAVEIRRRSEVLRAMEEPDWRLLTRRSTHGGKFDAQSLPLTTERLLLICADPGLDFVVAKGDVGFQPIPHLRPGPYSGWSLYACGPLRSAGSQK